MKGILTCSFNFAIDQNISLGLVQFVLVVVQGQGSKTKQMPQGFYKQITRLLDEIATLTLCSTEDQTLDHMWHLPKEVAQMDQAAIH